MAYELGWGTDPFDAELDALQKELAAVPVPRNPRTERLIQLRGMRGLDPTPEQAEYLRSVAPEKEARSERLASAAAELSGIPQLGRAARGIGEAVQDPSIPNVTNAAVQSSLAAFRPVTALKALGVGYASALANDIIGPNIPPAHGQTRKGGAPKVVLPGLSQEQQSFYDAAEKRLQRRRLQQRRRPASGAAAAAGAAHPVQRLRAQQCRQRAAPARDGRGGQAEGIQPADRAGRGREGTRTGPRRAVRRHDPGQGLREDRRRDAVSVRRLEPMPWPGPP